MSPGGLCLLPGALPRSSRARRGPAARAGVRLGSAGSGPACAGRHRRWQGGVSCSRPGRPCPPAPLRPRRSPAAAPARRGPRQPRHRSARGSGSAPRMTQLRCRARGRGDDGESPGGTPARTPARSPLPRCRRTAAGRALARCAPRRAGGGCGGAGSPFQLLRWWLKIPNPPRLRAVARRGGTGVPGVPAEPGDGSAQLPVGLRRPQPCDIAGAESPPCCTRERGDCGHRDLLPPKRAPGGGSSPGRQRPAGAQHCSPRAQMCAGSARPHCRDRARQAGYGGCPPCPRLAAGPGPAAPPACGGKRINAAAAAAACGGARGRGTPSPGQGQGQRGRSAIAALEPWVRDSGAGARTPHSAAALPGLRRAGLQTGGPAAPSHLGTGRLPADVAPLSPALMDPDPDPGPGRLGSTGGRRGGP